MDPRDGEVQTAGVAPSPLTPERWLTSWTLDLPVMLVGASVLLAYLAMARRQRDWPLRRCLLFAGGIGWVLVIAGSFLGVYNHTLLWVLAVQDVLLLTTAPVLLVLARPAELLRRTTGVPVGRFPSVPPLLGSLLAMTLLLAIYLSSWDLARLQHRWLFLLTQLALVLVGCAFLGPLLSEHGSSYSVRAFVALLDGLLDALPGLAVLGSHGLIAGSYYAAQSRSWGPTLAKDQQIGAMAMIALSELVGLPALLLLLVQWMRADAAEAATVDARLDVLEAAERAVTPDAVQQHEQRPWWHTDAGPLAERVTRERWQ